MSVDIHSEEFLYDLGRRAVSCMGWIWLMGTLTMPRDNAALRQIGENARTVSIPTSMSLGLDPSAYVATDYRDPPRVVKVALNKLLPDFDDPATVGNLLRCVRVAWNDAYANTRHSEYEDGQDPWSAHVHTDEDGMLNVEFFTGHSEAEALVVALEAAHNFRLRRLLAQDNRSSNPRRPRH